MGVSPRLTSVIQTLFLMVPRGVPLPEESWQARHRAVLVLLWLHVVAIAISGLVLGYGLGHALVEAAFVAAPAALATYPRGSRRYRAVAASLSLVTASAVLVHL